MLDPGLLTPSLLSPGVLDEGLLEQGHCSILDPRDPAQVAEYEQHFYLAYAGLGDNKLVHLIWDWDDARRRLRTRIPYRDQVIYTWRDHEGQLCGAMAVNVQPGHGFQGAAFGFAPQPAREHQCEILNVMATGHHRIPALSSYQAFIRDFGYADLVARGFEVAYSTCTRRRLRPYLWLGATLLDESSIDGEERFFLAWPVRELLAAPRGSSAPGPAVLRRDAGEGIAGKGRPGRPRARTAGHAGKWWRGRCVAPRRRAVSR
jgi:hypothetical protein